MKKPKLGIELEILWFPNTKEVEELSLHFGLVRPFSEESLLEAIIKRLEADFRPFLLGITKDGALEEIIFKPYTKNEQIGLYNIYETLLSQLEFYKFKTKDMYPIGIHHTVDVENWTKKEARNLIHIMFLLREVIFLVADRYGKNSKRADIYFLSNHFYDSVMNQKKWNTLKRFENLAVQIVKNGKEKSLLGLRFFPNGRKDLLEFTWYNATLDSLKFFSQIELTFFIMELVRDSNGLVTKNKILNLIKEKPNLSNIAQILDREFGSS